jgi:hypothetical protein
MEALPAKLNIETRRFSKGTFPYSPPTHTLKINSIVQAVLCEIDGNQFQDGDCGGHIENLLCRYLSLYDNFYSQGCCPHVHDSISLLLDIGILSSHRCSSCASLSSFWQWIQLQPLLGPQTPLQQEQCITLMPQ